MVGAPVDDPIRAEVERALRQAVGLALVAPFAVTARVQRCLARSIAWTLTPFRVVQSFLDLTVGGILSPVEDSLGVPRRGASGGAASPPATAATGRPAPSTVAVLDVGDRDARGTAVALPIEEYESLAASHVVARLEGLTAAELRAIEAFETAHRGRRTVLGKIDQLLARR